MRKYLFSLLLLAATPLVTNLSAQTVTGSIMDSEGQRLSGVTVVWAGTNVATHTDENGVYKLHRVKDHDNLVAMMLGFKNDTTAVKRGVERQDIKLESMQEIESITVHSSLNGNFISLNGIAKDEVISFAGLCKMACCSLAESFENSASVTVGFSDAISGARQIQMLGLAGTYTQILDENRTIMRGLSAPYGLSYTPGMWLNSIQVSKGISSVTAGHEAITGQINLEHRKPTDEERLFINLFINDELRPEANITTAQKVGKSGKLHTVLLTHVSADTDVTHADHNDDGFRDLPSSQQFNVANRWSYLASNGLQLRWGVKLLQEERLGGMVDYDTDRRAEMLQDGIYGSQIKNRGANGYFKVGTPVGKGIYDSVNKDELRSNVAFVVDYDIFDEDAYFGLNDYDGQESVVSMNLMYNKYFSASSSMIMGLSSQIQSIDEVVANISPDFGSNMFDLSRNENEYGAFAEYTYKYSDKFSLIAGLRGDYNDYYDSYHLTPRGQLKWSITPSTTLRASAGMGHRSANVVTDNVWMLATGREIIFESGTDSNFDRQERALTMGGSLTQRFGILKAGDATISVDYFRTQFSNSVVVDQEWDSSTIRVYNTEDRSLTDTYQIDFTWAPLKGFDIFTTFRYTDSSITLEHDGVKYTTERPLVSRYKALVNLQYATNMRRWTFDFTAQMNGSTRLPNLDGDMSQSNYSKAYPMFFAQVSRNVRGVDIYVGCENIGNYTQDNPILGADNPFSTDFNSSVIYAPLMGRKFYVGLRFNLY